MTKPPSDGNRQLRGNCHYQQNDEGSLLSILGVPLRGEGTHACQRPSRQDSKLRLGMGRTGRWARAEGRLGLDPIWVTILPSNTQGPAIPSLSRSMTMPPLAMEKVAGDKPSLTMTNHTHTHVHTHIWHTHAYMYIHTTHKGTLTCTHTTNGQKHMHSKAQNTMLTHDMQHVHTPMYVHIYTKNMHTHTPGTADTTGGCHPYSAESTWRCVYTLRSRYPCPGL